MADLVTSSLRQYHTAEFHELLLGLLRDDLRVAGWAHLPSDLPASLIHIHKVSGALTNAVFFVSIPPASFEINPEGLATPMIDDRQLPATPSSLLGVNSNDERAEQSPRARTLAPGQRITIEAPTLLVRVYGPSSGSLISRRTELHILHTLSTVYKIGPAVLGTFANGRVEEYFHSRALTKDEMRDPRFSRWIGRRMRELHRVEVEQMEPPIDDRSRSARSPSVDSVRSRSGSEPPERPSLENVGTISHKGSSTSIYSTSSGSSIFSFGSAYSASTAGSFSSSRSARSGSLSSDLGAPVVNSPLMMPCRGPSESRANTKKRSRRSMRSVRGKRSRDKLGVWENITRWTREAKMVLKELDKLSDTPGYYELLKASKAALAARKSSSGDQHIVPLASLAQTVELRSNVNLPLFEQQIKSYRSLVRDWERSEGKSKRVFAHNDTQYGNLLLLTPAKPEDEKRLEQQLQAPHQKIIVVDFEYASANPRGFDIGECRLKARLRPLADDEIRTTLQRTISSSGGPTTITRRCHIHSPVITPTPTRQSAPASFALTSVAMVASIHPTLPATTTRPKTHGCCDSKMKSGCGNRARTPCGLRGASFRRKRTCCTRSTNGKRRASASSRRTLSRKRKFVGAWRGWTLTSKVDRSRIVARVVRLSMTRLMNMATTMMMVIGLTKARRRSWILITCPMRSSGSPCSGLRLASWPQLWERGSEIRTGRRTAMQVES